MATEFKILRGQYASLFNEDGSPKLSHDKLVNGYWYLTNDTAEVFVCLPKFEAPETLWLYKINDVDTSKFVTEEQLTAAISAIEIPDVSTFATKEELESAIAGIVIPSLDGYATEEFVTQKIAEAQLADTDVDLSAYYTKTETDSAIQNAVDAIEIPEVPTKVSELENDSGFITIDDVTPTDLSGYYTKEEVDSKDSIKYSTF